MMRRTKKYFSVAVLAVALVLGLRSVASAAISGDFNSLQTGFGTAVQIDGSSALDTFRGGVLHWTQDSKGTGYSPTSLWNGSTFSSTAFISVSLGMTMDTQPGAHATYQLGAVAGEVGSPAAAYIAELWYNHMHDLASQGTASLFSKVFQDPRRTFIDAFQIAAWKLATDKGLDFNLASGQLTAHSGSAVQLAQTWLNQLQAEGTTGRKANLVSLSDGVDSPQIVELPPGVTPLIQVVPAPEPATIVIWGLFAAVGLASGGCRWKRRGGPQL
jgi:hypothetical protein